MFPFCVTLSPRYLACPAGGLILTNDVELGKKYNSAIFPGLQGGPLMHVIAAKAVAFGEALKPEFKVYTQQVRVVFLLKLAEKSLFRLRRC